METVARFGEELAALRVERCVSFRALARRTGLDAGYLCHLSTGRRGHRASDRVIELVAAGLGVSPDHFQEYRQRLLLSEHASEADELYWRLAG